EGPLQVRPLAPLPGPESRQRLHPRQLRLGVREVQRLVLLRRRHLPGRRPRLEERLELLGPLGQALHRSGIPGGLDGPRPAPPSPPRPCPPPRNDHPGALASSLRLRSPDPPEGRPPRHPPALTGQGRGLGSGLCYTLSPQEALRWPACGKSYS